MNAQIDISNVFLKTERLLLRPWKQSDLDDFFEYASVDGVGEWAGWSHHKDKEESQKHLDSFVNNKRVFAIVINNKVVGSLGIEQYSEEKYPEFDDKQVRSLGFVLSKDYWGQGLMTEAVKKVVHYLFEEVKLDAIICGHFIRNNRSARVQQKCGFKPYKLTKYETHYGTVEDEQINLLTKEDFNCLYK